MLFRIYVRMFQKRCVKMSMKSLVKQLRKKFVMDLKILSPKQSKLKSIMSTANYCLFCLYLDVQLK